ncbi:MAG TPA: hypothetical protein VED17_03105 [Nitrososphaerales archaeon]|nr:hypothetical protein [Nitrososphaerales archaeon]
MDPKFSIVCNDEPLSTALSNERELRVWLALQELVLALLADSGFTSEAMLFAWKNEPRHLATAKEPYAWRAAIEEIKNSDLPSKAQIFRKDPEKFVLITDKPVMLKIAGEITSALLHSYSSRHRISFAPVHSTSKEPSGLAR